MKTMMDKEHQDGQTDEHDHHGRMEKTYVDEEHQDKQMRKTQVNR